MSQSFSATASTVGLPLPTLHHHTASQEGAQRRAHTAQQPVSRSLLVPSSLSSARSSTNNNLEVALSSSTSHSKYQILDVDAMHNGIPEVVAAVVRDVEPQATVLGFERFQTSSSIRRLSGVRIIDANRVDGREERMIMVSMPPAPSLRLLRSERWLFGSEASMLSWVWESSGPDDHRPGPNGARGAGNGASKVCEEANSLEGVRGIRPLVPKMHRYHRDSNSPIASPYLVLSATPGKRLRSVVESMPADENTGIEKSVGSVVARLARIVSPSKRFGPAVAVLNPPDTENLQAGAQGMQYTGGTARWKAAFQSYLESVLRDGEDMMVHLPYGPLRAQTQRLGGVLNQIITPRLMFVDELEDSIHVEPSKDGVEPGGKVVGFSNTSTAFFGDPLLSTAFTAFPSKSFLRGFTLDAEDVDPSDPSTWRHVDGLIEDLENAPARMLLYRCLHAATALVRQYYRPSSERNKREMAARRALAEALAQLEKTEIVGLAYGVGGDDDDQDEEGVDEETTVAVTGGNRGGRRRGDLPGRASPPRSDAAGEPRRQDPLRRLSGMALSPAKRTKMDGGMNG